MHVQGGPARSDVLAYGFRGSGAGDDLVTTVTGRTVYIDVAC